MKSILVAFLLISPHLTFAQQSVTSKKYGTLEFVELDHGVAKVVKGDDDHIKNTPTGNHNWLKNLVITKVTDSIHAALHVSFGLIYMIKAKENKDINVVIEWIYPGKVVNDKGKTFKSIKYTTKRPTNIPSGSSYSIDAPFELIEGNWTLNIFLKRKQVYTRTFFLY